MKIWRVERPKYGAGVGLARVAAAAERAGLDLGFWSERCANITGSSGKGSTAAMLAQMLQQAGLRVGLFTSPHLLRLNERIMLDGAVIDDDALAASWARVEAAAAPFEAEQPENRLTAFEFMFLVAHDAFAAADLDFALMECGIGARYDATRLNRARLGALTSLALEHTALLGSTLELIAYDKLDAVAPGGTLYLGETAWPLRDRIGAYCALTGVKPVFLREGEGWRAEGDAIRAPLSEGEALLHPALRGRHQHNNAALAARLADDILRARGVKQRIAAIEQGAALTQWPGRLETISDDPPIVIDVGHTPDAVAAAAVGFWELQPPPAVLVCGASADKDADAIAAKLAPGFALAVATEAHHKGAPAACVAEALHMARPDMPVQIASDVGRAYALALQEARRLGAAIYVAGGLFLAAEFKAVHLGLDPAALAFF